MKRGIAIVAFAAGLLGPAAALAQGKFYAGAAFGKSDVDSSVVSGLITSGTVDGKDSAFKIFGGFQFHPNFAVELAYVDLGSMKYSGTFPNFFGTPLPVINGTVDITGFGAAVLGSLPLGDMFSVHGKVGFWGWDQTARDTTGGLPFSASANGSDIYYGAGATFQVTRMVGVRAEWEQYKMNSDKASLATLGVLFRF